MLRGLTFRGAHVPAEIVLGRRDQTKTETYKADIFSVSGRGSVSTVEFDRVLPLEALRALNNTFKTKPSATDVLTAELSLSVHGEEAVVEFSYQARQASYTILTAEALPIPPAVIAELNRDPIRYSMAVWRSLEPSSLMGLFVGKTFAGLDLTGAVEPRVAAVYGNMLGFPITIPEDDSPAARWWAEWKAKNFDADVQVADMVSMPTDGVHAEGVLGRANTAEKFDFTRFWDWQESPIPALAPPAAASQPAAAAPITPTAQFGAPMASLQALQTLPSSAFSGGLAEGLTTSVVDPGAMMEMAAKTAGAGIEANKAANLEVTKQSAAVRIAAMENLSKMSNARLGAMMKAEEQRASASETGPDPAKGEAAPASSSKPSKAGATPGGGPPAASSPQQTNTPAGQSPAAGRGTSADGPQTPGGAEPGPDTPAPDEGDAPPPHEDDEWRRTYEKDVGPFLIGQVALMNFQPNSIDLHPDDRAAIDALIQKHGQRLLPVSVAAEVDEAEMSSQERRIYLEKARIAGVQGALSQAGLPETRLGLALIPDTDAGPFKRRRVTLCYAVEKQPLSQATKGLNVDAQVPFEGAEVGKHYAVQAPMFDRDQYWLTEPAARIFLSNASRLRKYGATLTAPKFFFRPDDTLEGQDLYQLSAARWACYAELAVQAGFSIERVFDASGAGPTEADAASVELLFRIDRAPPSGPAPSPPGRTRKKSSSTRDPARDPMADTVSSAAGDFIEETPSEGVDRLVLLDFAKNDGRLRPLHRGVLEDFLKRIATTAGSLTVSASVSVDEAAAPDKGQSLAAQRFNAVVATAKRLNVPGPIRAPVFDNKPGPVADREARSVTITFERDSEIYRCGLPPKTDRGA